MMVPYEFLRSRGLTVAPNRALDTPLNLYRNSTILKTFSTGIGILFSAGYLYTQQPTYLLRVGICSVATVCFMGAERRIRPVVNSIAEFPLL